jgi:dGTP triphosphohydrolase
MNIDSILKRREDIIFRKIEDAYVLMPMTASAEEVEYLFNLNEIGSAIWEKMDGRKTIQDILNELFSEYEGDRKTIEAEAIEFINDLKEAKLIEVA